MSFKKIISILTILASFQSFALTPQAGLTELKKAYDALNFSIQVEWDQKDKKFYNKKVEDFHNTIKRLQNSGLTNSDLIKFIKTNIKDKNLANNIDELYETIQATSMTSTEARKFARSLDLKSRTEWIKYCESGNSLFHKSLSSIYLINIGISCSGNIYCHVKYAPL